MNHGGLEGEVLITKPDFKAKVIHGDYKGGIIEKYISFCRVYDTQRDIHKNDMKPQKGIAETVDICIEKGYLRKYLQEHRAEVEKIMFDMYNTEYVKEREQLSRIYESEIAVLRDVAVLDEKIKKLLVRRHGITTTYVQNLLDDEPSTSHEYCCGTLGYDPPTILIQQEKQSFPSS